MKYNSKNNHHRHDECKEHDNHRKYDDYKEHDHHKGHHDHNEHNDNSCNLENCHEKGLFRIRILDPNNFSLDPNTNIITVENNSAVMTFPNSFNKPVSIIVVNEIHNRETPATATYTNIELGRYEYDVDNGVFFVDVKGLTSQGVTSNNSNLTHGGYMRTYSDEPVRIMTQNMPEDLFTEVCNLF